MDGTSIFRKSSRFARHPCHRSGSPRDAMTGLCVDAAEPANWVIR